MENVDGTNLEQVPQEGKANYLGTFDDVEDGRLSKGTVHKHLDQNRPF